MGHLSEMYQDLAQGHVTLLQQVVNLQKFVKNHDGVMHRVMGFLHDVDAQQRRASRVVGPFGNSGMGGDGNDDDHPASPLQKASALLEEFSTANLPDKGLEQMSHDFHLRNEYSATPTDQGSSSMAPRAENSSAHIGYPVGNDLDNMVYPVGHTNGIDPINSEHINNIPYSLPANGLLPVEAAMPEMMSEVSSVPGRKKSSADSVWGMTKPRILLVEDDKVCARIGSKFLRLLNVGSKRLAMDLRQSIRSTTELQISILF